MFSRLFAESGLSLDRLRALVEVGAAGSIVRAAARDAVRQSQYSRQIKELEDFFRTTLIERSGKGIRFTDNGRELARISRFLLLGLSNFQRGCLGEDRTYRIGAGATFTSAFLLQLLSEKTNLRPGVNFAVEALPDDHIEQRLHELTLDFGIVASTALTRPLQLKKLLPWSLKLFLRKDSHRDRRKVSRALRIGTLPFVLATETPPVLLAGLSDYGPALTCNNFLEARGVLLEQGLPAFLPDYIDLGPRKGEFFSISVSPRSAGKANEPSASVGATNSKFTYSLAWNPRLLRLNPQAARQRDKLIETNWQGLRRQPA